jgi:hypothetical protein
MKTLRMLTLGILPLALFKLSSCTPEENPVLPPSIETVEPLIGSFEDTVTITGKNFIPGKTTVRFHDVLAPNIISESETQIIVTVPLQANTGKITLKVNDLYARSSEEFRVFNPKITSIDHAKGLPGTLVQITGTDLFLVDENYTPIEPLPIVKFNGVVADIVSLSPFFFVAVPEGAGIGKLTIEIDRFIVSSPNDFSVIPWVQRSDFERPTYGCMAFSIGKNGYIVGGYQGEHDVWEYDSENDTWTQKNGFPGSELVFGIAFSIGAKGYVGIAESKTFWEYDPLTDSWTQKADFPGEQRSYAIGLAIDGNGYVGAGYQTESPDLKLKDWWAYNPLANEWTQKTDLPGNTRANAGYFAIAGKGYVTTGCRDHDLWQYDPALDSWNKKADFPGRNRVGALSFAIASKGYVGTGALASDTDQNESLNDLWEYDADTDSWIEKEGVYKNSYYGSATVIDGKAFAGFGMSYGAFNSLEAAWEWWEYVIY